MEKEIAKIKKNDNTDIVVRIDEYNGKKGVTIREFVTSERYTGFTKSGTRIPVEAFESFKQAINSVDPADLVQEASAEAPATTEENPEM
jgi:hypothetical protein